MNHWIIVSETQKNIVWVICRIKQLRNYKKNHGVLWGPQLDKQRWRARFGILRVKSVRKIAKSDGIPASERSQTHALGRAATGIGSFRFMSTDFFYVSHFEQCTWIAGNLKQNSLIAFKINKQKLIFYMRNTHWIYSEELKEVDQLEDPVAHGMYSVQ